jgi:hypothetical protein
MANPLGFDDAGTALLAALAARPPIHLELDPLNAWVLLGMLQLALAHPANTGASARIARDIALTIEDALAPDGVLRELAEQGWRREETP